ncbi:condensation domain-containing protein, partial [Thermoactinomyces mirandus]
PGEVASRLLEHASVREAVVISRQNRSGEPELCAYFVASGPYTVDELRQFMSEKLPDYMIPVHFVELGKLPLTANGKVDKKALPAPANVGTREKRHTLPANPTEEKLAAIWKEVLGQDQIGTDESFFDRGGNSLKGMILSSKIHKYMHVDLPLREIFACPTIRQQAAWIQQKDERQYEQIPVAPKQEYYPVSSAQKRLYVVGQLEGTGTSYNMPYVFHIHGDLSVPSLEKALQALVERHESLRTSFHLIDGELKQKIHSEAELYLERYHTRNRLEVNRLIEQFIRPFDLEQAPLIRAGLIEDSENREYVLLIDLHHIISDGVSMNLLFQDLMKLIKGEDLPSLALQYKDYAVWQQSERETDLWKQHEQFWTDELSGELPVLDLPTDYSRPAVQQFDGEHIPFEIDPGLTRQLKKLVEEQNVTLYMVLLAAYNVLLAKYTGKEDIIVGSPIAGRSHVDLQSVVGMFANTLAVRNRPQPELLFTDFLKQVKERVLSMYEHQDYPFEELVKKLDTGRDLSRNPLFDTMFAMQNIELPAFELPGLKIRQGEFSWKKAKFDMSWMMAEQESKESLNGVVEYSTHLFRPGTVQRMIHHFIHILRQIVHQPNIRLREMELATPEEKQKLLQTFKG